MAKSRPGAIHKRIIEVLERHPEGISAGKIRAELGLGPSEQVQLDRRRRDLRKWYLIDTSRCGRETLYFLRGERARSGEGAPSLRVRAEVLRLAHGRCGMCGRTIAGDGVKLVVDHKLPDSWGGPSDLENLWAICEECNAGKKAHFSSLQPDEARVRRALGHQSVHVRIGELLKAFGTGAEVPAELIAFVADQDDWKKRLRELRYPVVGWEIDMRRRRVGGQRTRVFYVLRRWRPWADDPTRAIREYESRRGRENGGG